MIKKWVYSSYVIIFDSAGSWNFADDFARNIVIFGVDSSSSSHADNRKNNFLVLGEGPTFGSSEVFSDLLILVKQAQNFA